MTIMDFAPANSLAQAVALLNSPGVRSKPVAGGTDLVVQMRHRGPWFDRLVEVSGIPELRMITETSDEVNIGAAVTFAQAAANPLLRSTAPFLVEACLTVGSPQIRNVGTLGGNVANAAACADTLPPLVALSATARIIGKDGERRVPVTELVAAPHRTGLIDGELIVSFSFTKLPARTQSAFVKLGRRNAQAIARLSIAAAGGLDEAGKIQFIRVAPGAAIPRTQRMTEVEDLLFGRRPSTGLFADAGSKAAEVMLNVTGRRWSTEYKEIAIQGLVEQALRRVFDGAMPA